MEVQVCLFWAFIHFLLYPNSMMEFDYWTTSLYSSPQSFCTLVLLAVAEAEGLDGNVPHSRFIKLDVKIETQRDETPQGNCCLQTDRSIEASEVL